VDYFAGFDRAQSAPPSPSAESPAREDDAAAFPRPRHLDAAAEHIEHGRLPDLNALAALMLEMRSAQRAYELNLQMMDATHAMMARTVDLLRH
jgi:flagellar basal body rod protein FlgC